MERVTAISLKGIVSIKLFNFNQHCKSLIHTDPFQRMHPCCSKPSNITVKLIIENVYYCNLRKYVEVGSVITCIFLELSRFAFPFVLRHYMQIVRLIHHFLFSFIIFAHFL